MYHKIFRKCHWVHFVLAIWAWSLLLGVVYISSEIPLEKKSYSSERVYRLEIASELGMGACVHFPSQRWDPIWLRLCRPHAHCHRLYEFRSAWVSLVSSILIGPYNLCTSSSIGFPHPIVAVTLTTQATLEVRTRQDPPIVLELAFIGLCLLNM